ncbi:MAG: hypothetical protein OCD02_04850 [Spirochaetaceae bacterium]
MKEKIIIILFTLTFSLYGQVSEYSEIQITPQENWKINNQNYQILKTVITGNALYTIQLIVESKPTMEGKSKDFAMEVAKYAIKNGYLSNALKYNNYSNQFHIYDSLIGIVLMHIDDPINNTVSGSRFAFNKEELNNVSVKNELISSKFKDKEKNELIKKIKDIIDNRYFEDLIDLYSPNALDDIDIEDTKLKTTMNFSLAKEMEILDNSFLVYIDIKSGIKGFDFYIPIKITTISKPNKEFNAYIKVVIVDDEPEYGIYNIQLNFPNSEDYNSLVLVGDINVPIKQR